MRRVLALLVLLAAPDVAFAADLPGAPVVPGSALGLIWIVPFAALLLAIAIMPLAAPHFWEHHMGKVAAACAAAFLLPFGALFGLPAVLHTVLHAMLLEYIPFIVLLLALFTAAGGVRLAGPLVGTPATNTVLLLVGTAIASLMGTTGACMLLIQPLIRANRWRRRNVHIFIFFTILVGNIGGSLTPLGDPPLFIGFLEGVDFFWVTERMFLPMLAVAIPLLAVFYAVDSVLFRKEGPMPAEHAAGGRLRIDGKRNFLVLLGVIVAVFASGAWSTGIHIPVYSIQLDLESVLRTLVLAALAGVSLWITRHETRRKNDFAWGPILEVAKLFAGIFITIAPVLAIIRAGADGPAGTLVALLNEGGRPDDMMYFWVTGALSSVLDNAPTYLLFFNFAGGDEQALMGPLARTLLAISAGSVFFGAMTYVGNAPNFLVRSIAETQGIRMPSFFGYILWSAVLLVPLFLLVTALFFLR